MRVVAFLAKGSFRSDSIVLSFMSVCVCVTHKGVKQLDNTEADNY